MTWSFRNIFYNSKGKKASDIGLFSGDRRRGTVSYLDQLPATSSILGLGASSLWSLHLWSQASSFSSLWNLPLPSSNKGNLWEHLGPPGKSKIIAPSQNFTLITPAETLFPYIKGRLQIPDIRTWYLWRPLFCLRTICALTSPVMSLRGKPRTGGSRATPGSTHGLVPWCAWAVLCGRDREHQSPGQPCC